MNLTSAQIDAIVAMTCQRRMDYFLQVEREHGKDYRIEVQNLVQERQEVKRNLTKTKGE